MSRIVGDNLKPETRLRMALVRQGLRFRRNVKSLPGSPDFVFGKERLAVFVHGCFWHGHNGCYRPPKSNTDFWRKKLAANRERDARARRRLNAMGWETAVVWECAIYKDARKLALRIARKTAPPSQSSYNLLIYKGNLARKYL